MLNNCVYFFLDIDECAQQGCHLESKCKNTFGSFSCECYYKGFKYVNSKCVGMLCLFVFFVFPSLLSVSGHNTYEFVN